MNEQWHVVFCSSGIGSWAAGKRIAAKHGTDRLIHLFADTLIEDADNYRFLPEAVANTGGTLIKVSDGRDPFTLWRAHAAIASNRVPFCSDELKQRVCREFLRTSQISRWQDIPATIPRNKNAIKWREFWAQRYRSGFSRPHLSPENTVLHVGIDWSEVHRLPAIEAAWRPYQVTAPMTEPPYLDKPQVLAWARSEGLTPPRLYELGYPHANCGGGCVRAGQGQWKHTLQVAPHVFARWEAEENAMRSFLDKDVAMLTQTINGIKRPYPLSQLRADVAARGQLDLLDWGGCGCFTDNPDL